MFCNLVYRMLPQYNGAGYAQLCFLGPCSIMSLDVFYFAERVIYFFCTLAIHSRQPGVAAGYTSLYLVVYTCGFCK